MQVTWTHVGIVLDTVGGDRSDQISEFEIVGNGYTVKSWHGGGLNAAVCER